MTWFRRLPLGLGTAVGALAFLFGYVATWILAGTKAANLTTGGSVPDWKVLLWLFYDSHFVGTHTPEVRGPGGGLWGGGELIDTVGAINAEYLFAVPIVLLLIAGATVAARTGVTTLRDGLEAGLTITIGYLLVAILALFPASAGGIAPSPVRAIMIAGIVYPVVFGAIGGFTAAFLRDTT